MTGLSERGEAALKYAIERNWAVLPLWWITRDGHCACGRPAGGNHKSGKHPIGKLVPNGHKNATKEPEQIRAWWQRFPEANIGVVMGDISEIFAIDLDGAQGHMLLDAERQANNASPIETLISQSGRGPDGHHLIFNIPPGKNIKRVLCQDFGVDIIGKGGYIVAPPSNHISGGEYKWISNYPVADAAPWLVDWVLSLFDKSSASKERVQKQTSLNHPGVTPPNSVRPARLIDRALLPSPAPMWSKSEDARLRSALDFVDAKGKRVWDPDADYQSWSTVAAAIASLGWGRNGEDIFIDWSKRATVTGLFPGDEECRKQVRSYKRGRTARCKTEATIFKPVRDCGWKETNSPTSANADASLPTDGTQNISNTNLPVLDVTGGGLSDEATAGEEAIISAGYPVYRRGKSLVRPVIEEADASGGRRTKIAQLTPISLPYMIDLLCKSAQWMGFDKRERKRKRINPSRDMAQIILHRFGDWRFKPVIGVITTPTLRPDGSILEHPGYDFATKLILMDPPPMPGIPERPTRDDALTALKLLDSLLDEFPFADDGASRSVALSCLITPVVRGAFSVAPMHAARAPAAGTGKSYIFDIAAAIAIGQPCPVMAAGKNEEETEKRLGAALIAGQPIINIDNVNGELGGDALCQVIERPVVDIRILGKSELVRIEARCTVFATGNNLRLVGDMTRRVVLCTLDARQERPELRQFKRDPVAEVLADRGRYVAAALTVVRGYLVAGRPSPAPRLASFEGWSDTVRSALIWLGRPDPVATMETARKDDPNLQAMEAIFAVLKEAIGIGFEKANTVAQIVALADEREPGINGYKLLYSGLKEALLNVANDRGTIDARELGKWFSRHKGRIANGVRLEGKADDHGHSARWWLINCG